MKKVKNNDPILQFYRGNLWETLWGQVSTFNKYPSLNAGEAVKS